LWARPVALDLSAGRPASRLAGAVVVALWLLRAVLGALVATRALGYG
jgi:hypothetical protein